MVRRLGPWGILVLMALLVLALPGGEAGQPAKTKTQTWTGALPIGEYTYPQDVSGFANGINVPNNMSHLGVEMNTAALFNPLTQMAITVELSHDGGTTWPPEDKTQPIPADTDFCAATFGRATGQALSSTPPYVECAFGRATGAQTRARLRMHVSGASTTATVSLTWRSL